MDAKSSPAKLEYQKKYNAQPEQVKARTETNAARRHAEAAGLVHKGDGKDVAHIKPVSKGGSPSPSNIKVQAASTNRAWREGQSGYSVPTSPRSK